MSLVTKAEYARMRAARGLPGGTRAGVGKAVDTGRITAINGMIDPEAADLQWAARTDPEQQRATKTAASVEAEPEPSGGKKRRGATETKAEASARKEIALANQRELDYEKSRRAVLDRAEVSRLLGDMIVTAKTNLRGIGAKIAPDCAAETDAAKCQAMIDAEVDEVLLRISSVSEQFTRNE